MIARLHTERRAAGRAAIQAQEQERRRIAADLHDEVNQALTAVSLRLQASIERAPGELRRELAETKRLSSQAMEELLALARQLRPAVLDDHGLLAALPQPGPGLRRPDPDPRQLQLPRDGRGADTRGRSSAHLPRDAGVPLEHRAARHGADNVEVELSFNGGTALGITDDGCGFKPNSE